jgi:superfamily II DNA or RNA helicase
VRWALNGTVVEARVADQLDDRQSRLRHRTVQSTAVGDGIVGMIRDADARLTLAREHGHPDAGGLVVACDIEHAKRIGELLERETCEQPVVVTSDDPDASQQIERFANGTQRWAVSVAMITEGQDIPRLRVGVSATTVKTPLFFRQVIGRFVRTRPGRSQVQILSPRTRSSC